MKNDKKAKEHYKKSASIDLSRKPGIMNYYQGLSYLELKDKSEAKEIFNALVESGNEQLDEKSAEGEFFAIFVSVMQKVHEYPWHIRCVV